MEFRQLSGLKEYEVNNDIKLCTKSQMERLKKDLDIYGQLENMLVTADGLVISGNHRLKAMKELGWTEARCDLISFEKEEEGWYAILKGEPQRTKYFKSKEAAMFHYSVKYNDSVYSTYNKEKLMTYAETYELPFTDIQVPVENIASFATVINAEVNLDKVMDKLEEKRDKKIKEIDVICPKCGEAFKKEI